MTKFVFIFVLVVLALGLAYVALFQQDPLLPTKTYNSETYHLSFIYPENYFLEEKELGNGERMHHAIILMEDTEENRAIREGNAPIAREGPVTINIDIYQNNLDKMTAEGWIKNTNESNYKLSTDSALSPQNISSLSGLSYRWSGLYEGETTAVANANFVYAFTVTFMDSNDQIIKDYEEILKTVVIK